jgi:hypothetical protein
MKHHDCCYYKCVRPGTIFIGANGNPDTDWICAYHYDKWHADRARFIADGFPCEMEEL